MLALQWEKRSPLIVALVAAIVTYWCGEDFFRIAVDNSWHLDAMYASVFNLTAAASAFLFAFYTYVRTAEGNILRQIRAAPIFNRASRHMILAIALSALLAVLTVPFVVVVPQPRLTSDRWYWAVVVWAGLSGYVFAAIVRSAYHFTAIMEASFGDRLDR